ncbi:MAG: hypothetical protein KGI29_08060 [Pseudomonadota bacterium]|nr:hypothetical protein [Pseudomonadota bacterium]
MTKIEGIQSASQVAAANGAMSYREWAGMHMYPVQRTAIGAVAGLVGGGLLAAAFPAYAIALVASGTVVGAAGGFYSAMRSIVSPKMVSSYIDYVNTSTEGLEKTRQLNQAKTVPVQNAIEMRESENVARLEAQASAPSMAR